MTFSSVPAPSSIQRYGSPLLWNNFSMLCASAVVAGIGVSPGVCGWLMMRHPVSCLGITEGLIELRRREAMVGIYDDTMRSGSATRSDSS